MANGRPFGNDFLVGTPSLDQLGQRLYADQRNREMQRQKEISSLDEEFSKNVSNIRDADVDDFTKAYQDYKLSSQEAMRKKGGVSPQEQMELLRKKANMYKLMNESKSEKEREELTAKRYTIKPDDFNDNASSLMIEGRKLPISKKRSYITKDEKGNDVTIDLTDTENLLWQDKTNWQPILQKAGGTLTQRGTIVKNPIPGGLETEEITYKGGNDPLEYYTGLVGAMNTPRASQSLANRYKFTPEEAQDIVLKFEELKKSPAFKNAYGDIKFPESANLTEGTRTAKLLAMVNALNNPPTETKRVVKDLAKVKDRDEAFKIKMEGIKDSNIRRRQRYVTQPGLGDYDIFSYYDGKVKTIKHKSGKDWTGKPTETEVVGIYVKDIDGDDLKYYQDDNTKPYIDDNGDEYFIQRENGDYEGRDGKVISRNTGARLFMKDATSDRTKRGFTNQNLGQPNKPQNNSPQPRKKVNW